MANEVLVTFQGWVGGDVVHRETREGHVANFRVGSTPRVRRRTGDWVDGATTWFSVTCWRALADHVRDSVRKGDPVLVHGRLRTDVWERQDGQSSTTNVVDAVYVGHDLSRGTAVFVKAARPDRSDADDADEDAVKAMIHSPLDDLGQLDSDGQPRERRDTPASSPAA